MAFKTSHNFTKRNRTNIFHGTSLDFPEIDINEVIEKLEVKEEAHKDGNQISLIVVEKI